jgi:hypothetical protein
MPLVRFLAFERRAYVVVLILSLGEIMPTYSHYAIKGLVCIIIAAPFSQQPSSYSEYMKLNMRSSCNIQLVSKDKCTCRTCFSTY